MNPVVIDTDDIQEVMLRLTDVINLLAKQVEAVDELAKIIHHIVKVQISLLNNEEGAI